MTSTHPTFTTGPRDALVYDEMIHTPGDSLVRSSYRSLATAIVGQWNGLLTSGFVFRASDVDPYASSEEMLASVNHGQRLYAFTDGGATLPDDHPMRALPSRFGAIEVEGFTCLNDVFRAVHDVMGHWAAHRAGEVASFGPVGEYNAWRQHYRTLPTASRLALWCETRGQNAWTNFYADHASKPVCERPYAEQKCGIPYDITVIHPVD